MIKDFKEAFWNYSKKPIKFDAKTIYSLDLSDLLKNNSNKENAIELLCVNLRRIRMKSEFLYNDVVNKNKIEIEAFLEKEYERKQKAYYNKRRKDKYLPKIKTVFDKIDYSLLFNNSIAEIVDKYFLSLEIKENEPLSPVDYYPEARKLNRRFIIHVGGTNTGKTYHSLKRLKEVYSGIYLGPLRLLALEVQENLSNADIKCNLLTGEERKIIDGATHTSSTVEMLNLREYYDVVVIDECQMIGDKWRGGHWVKAILGVLSTEIHLCTAPEALDLIKKLIESCEDTYEIIQHKRTTPLRYMELSKNFNIKTDIQKGDALVVFSRKSVLSLAAELESCGKKASVIYGALPYDTRKLQMERFLNGETEVVVATDAIGMGLNLPIKRIIFMEGDKFDGEKRRILRADEIKQIAGRAGRMGIYDEGFVSTIEYRNHIKKSLTLEIPQIEQCYLDFPEKLLDLDSDIEKILNRWYAESTKSYYYKQEISEILTSLEYLKKFDLTKKEKYQLCTIPFDSKIYELRNLWVSYCKKYINSEELYPPEVDESSLYSLETSYKALDLYYGFAQKMNMSCDENWIHYMKYHLSHKINQEILKTLKNNRKKCRICGKNLPFNYKYNLCNSCYKKMYTRDYFDWYY